MAQAAAIARSHHEAWDGSGYPDGRKGADIPMPARITAVADVLDALAADRCYKKSWSYLDALNEVFRLAGSTLDPAVVEALRAADEAGDIYPIVAVLSDSFARDGGRTSEAGAPSDGTPPPASSADDNAAA
jgi:HD-GYP domain-containing protein (c-di-GMP phosphodiesterase class II)